MKQSPVVSRQSQVSRSQLYLVMFLRCIYSLPRLRGRVGVGVTVLVVLLFATACIPATVPDNLDDTPGPPVVINNSIYEGAVFTARVPNGWRVITSEAQAPQSVIFVTPDDKTLIRLIEGEVELSEVEVEGQRNELYPLTLADGTTVTAVFSSPALSWETYWAQFETVRDSVSSR